MGKAILRDKRRYKLGRSQSSKGLLLTNSPSPPSWSPKIFPEASPQQVQL